MPSGRNIPIAACSLPGLRLDAKEEIPRHSQGLHASRCPLGTGHSPTGVSPVPPVSPPFPGAPRGAALPPGRGRAPWNPGVSPRGPHHHLPEERCKGNACPAPQSTCAMLLCAVAGCSPLWLRLTRCQSLGLYRCFLICEALMFCDVLVRWGRAPLLPPPPRILAPAIPSGAPSSNQACCTPPFCPCGAPLLAAPLKLSWPG
jgi:hypothetical protein